MKSLKLKTILIMATTVFLTGSLVFGFVGESLAGTSQNVSGWAWSSNIGWISFNNTTGGGGYDYGVNLDDSGNFSGYAWSSNIGWVSFNRSDTGNPSSNDPGSGSGAIAKYNSDTGKILGWARALSQGGGWDGWIALGDMNTNDAFNYGASINSSNSDFEGWAWGSDVVGWISFNCANPTPQNPSGVCGTSNYKITTTSPAVGSPPNPPSNLSISLDYCNDSEVSLPGMALPTFSWTYVHPRQKLQAAYEIRIDDDPDFSIVDNDEFTYSMQTASGLVLLPQQYFTNWQLWMKWEETTYWWIVRVKDSNGKWSGWSTEQRFFTTPKHPYPYVEIFAIPGSESCPNPVNKITQAAKNSSVRFCSNIEFFADFPEGEIKLKPRPPYPAARYLWAFQKTMSSPPVIEYFRSAMPSTTIKWSSVNLNPGYPISFRVDDDYYRCTKRMDFIITSSEAPPPPPTSPPTSPEGGRYQFKY